MVVIIIIMNVEKCLPRIVCSIKFFLGRDTVCVSNIFWEEFDIPYFQNINMIGHLLLFCLRCFH